MLADLGGSAPDAGFIDIFKLKYDYHNAKAVLKAAAVGTDPARMLMDMGRIPASELKSAMESSELDTLPLVCCRRLWPRRRTCWTPPATRS